MQMASRRYRPSRLSPVLYLVVSVFLCIAPQNAHASDDASTLLARLNAAMKDRDDIAAADEMRVSRELTQLLQSTDVQVPFTQMSEARKRQVASLLDHFLQSYPTGRFATPLQREAHLQETLMRTKVLLAYPVYTASDTTKIGTQLARFDAILVDWAESTYPEIRGTMVADELRQHISKALRAVADDDLTPAFKRPLDDSQFDTQVKLVNERLGRMVMRPLVSDVAQWDRMDAQQRRDHLNANASNLALSLSLRLQSAITELGNEYAYATYDQDAELAKRPEVASDVEVAKFRKLVKEAREEHQRLVADMASDHQQRWKRAVAKDGVLALDPKAFSFDREDAAIARFGNLDSVGADIAYEEPAKPSDESRKHDGAPSDATAAPGQSPYSGTGSALGSPARVLTVSAVVAATIAAGVLAMRRLRRRSP